MNFSQKSVIFLSVILSTVFFVGYDVNARNSNDQYLQGVRIGLVDEFFERFNDNENHPDLPVDDLDGRLNNLLVLFDLNKLNSGSDSLLYEAKIMMNKVIADSIRLNFEDTGWLGKARCDITVEGKPAKCDVYLAVEEIKPEFYKWVIASVEGDFLEIEPINDNEKNYILPNAHEMNFLQLHRISEEQPRDIKKFLGKNAHYDMTSVFAYLLHAGKLKINHVENLEFIFTQIPGYVFKISYIDRKSNNSGWLITDFYKLSVEEKQILWNKLCHIPQSIPYSIRTYNIENLNENEMLNDKLEVYYNRLNERLSHVINYLSFIQDCDSVKKSVYVDKLKNIFVPEAKVVIASSNRAEKTEISIENFCDSLINNSVALMSCDSICSPFLSKDQIMQGGNQDTILCKSINHPFLIQSGSEKKYVNSSNDILLPVIREQTETGEEWIPLFGNIYLTLVPNKDEDQ